MPKIKFATPLKPVDTAHLEVVQYRAKANTSAIANTTTETSILGAAADGTGLVIAAARINQVGAKIRWKILGKIANTGTPNITLQVKLGSSVLWTSGTIASSTITGTRGFKLEGEATVTTAGSTGVIEASGSLTYGVDTVSSVTVTNDSTQLTAQDLTSSLALSSTLTWGTAHASNTATGKAGSEILISPVGN